MKKILSILLAIGILFLFGCSAPAETEPTAPAPGSATEAEIAQLEALYAGRQVFYGNLHEHSASGDPVNDPWKTADGKFGLDQWPSILKNLQLDFVAIVDHRQSKHMRSEYWDETMFLGATETGHSRVSSTDGNTYSMDYNILMNDVDKFEEILKTYPQFNFVDGCFKRVQRSEAEMDTLQAAIREAGGIAVHVHPRLEGYLSSNDPTDYYLGEYTGLEVLYSFGNINMSAPVNQEAYNIWIALLSMGKHVYAFSGADTHAQCNTISTAAVYAEERLNDSYLKHIVNGDFTAGPVGIRMSIGDATMGGHTAFDGKRLIIAVGDFHPMEYKTYHRYFLKVYSEAGQVFTQEIDPSQTNYFAIDTTDCKFYRAEIYNATEQYIFALGNPIWNE